jgi:HKD family nuclease
MEFDNIKLRVIGQYNFHIKGYIFKYEDHRKYITRSSNLTQNALTRNLERNV